MDKRELSYWQSLCDPWWLETMGIVHKGKDVQAAIREAYGHLIADEQRLMRAEPADFKRLVNGWLTNKRFPKPNSYSKPQYDLK